MISLYVLNAGVITGCFLRKKIKDIQLYKRILINKK